MFQIIGWALFGFIVGLIARGLVPGKQPMGIFWTMILGIGGSFVGGLLGYLTFGGSLFQSSGWIGSIIGAVVLLVVQLKRKHRNFEDQPKRQHRIEKARERRY